MLIYKDTTLNSCHFNSNYLNAETRSVIHKVRKHKMKKKYYMSY